MRESIKTINSYATIFILFFSSSHRRSCRNLFHLSLTPLLAQLTNSMTDSVKNSMEHEYVCALFAFCTLCLICRHKFLSSHLLLPMDGFLSIFFFYFVKKNNQQRAKGGFYLNNLYINHLRQSGKLFSYCSLPTS